MKDNQSQGERLATALSSVVAMSATIVVVAYGGSTLILKNDKEIPGMPGWLPAVAAFTFFGGVALWFVSWFLVWRLPEAKRRGILIRHLVGAVMLVLLFVAPLFAEPKLAKKMAQTGAAVDLALG